MDLLKTTATQLTTFAQDVSASYSNLSLVPRVIIGGAVSCFALQTLGKWVQHPGIIMFFSRQMEKKPKYKDGVIYVHVFPSTESKKVPSSSPFVLKMETWLRLHKVQHERVETTKFAKSTGQIPYIIYNGKEYADSELIIDFLQKELNIKDDITPTEMGIQRAFISMLDERVYFIYNLHRHCYSVTEFVNKFALPPGLPAPIIRFLARHTLPRMWMQRCIAQGIGRKPRDVIISIGNNDLKALSLYLGDKKFLAGDKITRADCCAFGHLCQMIYVDLPYPYTDFMRRECPNLEPYINRIKAELWPDWSSIVDESIFK